MDWEAEGLLDGLDDAARAARVGLLDQLHSDGVPLEELRRAVEEERLALLPVERRLAGEPRYTDVEVAERAGIDVEWLRGYLRALGLALPAPDVRAYSDEDVEDARRGRSFREAGLGDAEALAVARVLGLGMARYADAFRWMFGQAFLQAGDTEIDLARRYLAAADHLRPMAGPHFAHVFFLHLREIVRSDMITAEERRSGRLEGRTQAAVAFADLVGFTELGEAEGSEALGTLADRLTALAERAGRPPARLVKTIGDAVMFVAPEPAALVDVALDMVDGAEQEELPPLRAGLAFGPAVNRWGDWYGSTVNLASRLCARARPRSVLAPAELPATLGDAAGRFRFTDAGRKRLKGVATPVRAVRIRRGEA